MSEQIVRYTFTVYCDTPVITEGDPDDTLHGDYFTGPEMTDADAKAALRRALARTDFCDTDFELMDTETLDC
jgi:hypothetical protein